MIHVMAINVRMAVSAAYRNHILPLRLFATVQSVIKERNARSLNASRTRVRIPGHACLTVIVTDASVMPDSVVTDVNRTYVNLLVVRTMELVSHCCLESCANVRKGLMGPDAR